MELRIGDYVRTKRGTFDRFIISHTQDNLTWYTFEDGGNITNPENYVIKSSPNIIDLIEVGDYVNGYKVIDIVKNFKVIIDKLELDTTTGLYHNIGIKDIKSIVTKEQFESMEYKVKE